MGRVVGLQVLAERTHCRVFFQFLCVLEVCVACVWLLLWWLGVWWVVCELYSGCEHLYCVFCVLLFLHVFMFVLCLVFVGIRWMPWYQELMKDVAACDNPWGVGERALI